MQSYVTWYVCFMTPRHLRVFYLASQVVIRIARDYNLFCIIYVCFILRTYVCTYFNGCLLSNGIMQTSLLFPEQVRHSAVVCNQVTADIVTPLNSPVIIKPITTKSLQFIFLNKWTAWLRYLCNKYNWYFLKVTISFPSMLHFL